MKLMFVVPLSCPSICGPDKFIFLPCNILPGNFSQLGGRWKKKSIVGCNIGVHQILKHTETDGITTPGPGAGAQHLRRVQSSPCSRTYQPKAQDGCGFY